jgi:hypothetical protein
MNSKVGLIGMVMLIALLSEFAIWEHGQLSAERTHSVELQNTVSSLVQEVATLKETADYYFQNGVTLQAAGNLQEAKTAFEAVVAKFPTSNLVGSAQQRLAAVSEAIAKAEADKAAEAQRQRAELAKQVEEEGEWVDYKVFYAKALSTGLPIDKRYRFVARVSHLLILDLPNQGFGLHSSAAFDDEAQYERFLQGSDDRLRTVVASMGSNGTGIQIHRIE